MSKTDTAEQIEAARAAEQEAQPEQSIALIVEHNPSLVLIQPEKRDQLIEHVKQEIADFVPDLTTAAGRDLVRAFAAKITKTKTTLDQTAKDLTEDWRAKTSAVNAERKIIVDTLADLAKEARKPLTDWENAEELRVTECEQAIASFTAAGVVTMDATSESIAALIADIEAREIDPARFQGMTEAAIKARNHTLELLRAALERIKQAERERAELAELREKARLRDEAEAAERAEREAAAAAEQEATAAREAEANAAAEAERQREADAQREAQQREEAAATAAREERARAEQEAREREAEQRAEHERELVAERERTAEAERHAQALRDGEAARERLAEIERERVAQAEANMAHRTGCKTAAKEALLTTGVTEEQAKGIVLLIIAGEVPYVAFDFAAQPKVTEEKADG